MTDLEKWTHAGRQYGWVMPQASWWKRLPIIRHFRAAYHKAHIEQHNAFYLGLRHLPKGYDRWVIWGMAHGKERRND